MSLSMRECIRWLKKEVSDIVEEEPPLTDDEVIIHWKEGRKEWDLYIKTCLSSGTNSVD